MCVCVCVCVCVLPSSEQPAAPVLGLKRVLLVRARARRGLGLHPVPLIPRVIPSPEHTAGTLVVSGPREEASAPPACSGLKEVWLQCPLDATLCAACWWDPTARVRDTGTSCQSLGPGPLSGGLHPSAWRSLCTQHLRGYQSGFPEPPSSVIAKPVPDGGKSSLPFITPPPPPTWGLCVASPGDQVLL